MLGQVESGRSTVYRCGDSAASQHNGTDRSDTLYKHCNLEDVLEYSNGYTPALASLRIWDVLGERCLGQQIDAQDRDDLIFYLS